MKQSFTPNRLIKYLYKDMTPTETLAIIEQLSQNQLLRSEYEQLAEGYKELPKVTFSPSSETIQGILAYSQETAVEIQH